MNLLIIAVCSYLWLLGLLFAEGVASGCLAELFDAVRRLVTHPIRAIKEYRK